MKEAITSFILTSLVLMMFFGFVTVYKNSPTLSLPEMEGKTAAINAQNIEKYINFLPMPMVWTYYVILNKGK